MTSDALHRAEALDAELDRLFRDATRAVDQLRIIKATHPRWFARFPALVAADPHATAEVKTRALRYHQEAGES